MSIRPWYRGIVPDLEKIVIVSPSMAKAIPKEVESTVCMAAAEQSRLVAMGSMNRGQCDKTIPETQKAKIARYAVENGIAAALRHFKTKQSIVCEYFTHEYFNTTVPSNHKFKNTKVAKLANS